MWDVFSSRLKVSARESLDRTTLDNNVCALYYRVTAWAMVLASLALSAKQYFGDPIDCEAAGVKLDLLDQFCWVTGTYTVHELKKQPVLKWVMAPGVGQYNDEKHTLTHHTYYQWASLVLFLSGARFYLPRLFWKLKEGGKMETITAGMKHKDPQTLDHSRFLARALTQLMPSMDVKFWSDPNLCYLIWFRIFELLNPINIIIELGTLTWLFHRDYFPFGSDYLSFLRSLGDPTVDTTHLISPLDELFPKVTMCTYKKYGLTSEKVDVHANCVLPLNVVNEKIYLLLWFWLMILLAITIVQMIMNVFSSLPSIRPARMSSTVGLARQDAFVSLSIGGSFLAKQIQKNVSDRCYFDLIRVLGEIRRTKKVNENASLDGIKPPLFETVEVFGGHLELDADSRQWRFVESVAEPTLVKDVIKILEDQFGQGGLKAATMAIVHGIRNYCNNNHVGDSSLYSNNYNSNETLRAVASSILREKYNDGNCMRSTKEHRQSESSEKTSSSTD